MATNMLRLIQRLTLPKVIAAAAYTAETRRELEVHDSVAVSVVLVVRV